MKDNRKIWQVQERDTGFGRAVVSGQTRYIIAASRTEAKEIYTAKHKKYPTTTLTANIVSDDLREWAGPRDQDGKAQNE